VLSADPTLETSDLQSRFDQLQRKLVRLWESIGRADPGGALEEENTVVVVPSLSIDVDFPISALQAYEERLLFMLFILRQPLIRLIYATSVPIQPNIVEYYLDLLPGVVASSARQRLFLVSPHDGSSRPLTEKLLKRPRLIEHIRALIPDPDRAHLVPFNTTDLERELALRLGIPMYAPDPRFFAFGTKSGCRRIFAEEGVPHPLGLEDLFSADDIVGAIAKMRARKPSIGRVIVKLNEGVSGQGNAVVDLDSIPPPGDPSEQAALAGRLQAMRCELEGMRYQSYIAKAVEHGAIVEELIEGQEIASPSAQLRISPLGEVEMLSTHDQMLGGPSGQSYLGARFPADPAYAPLIMREAAKVGRRLAREGIVGRFAIDFVVVRNPDGTWEPYAIEVNLRKGGTTHPFLTLQYLTDGRYEAETGVFTTANGHQKCYVASDHVESPAYRVFTPDALFEIVSRHRLHFDSTNQSGLVMFLMSCVATDGRLGVTAIGDTPEQADALFQRFIAVLDEEARLEVRGVSEGQGR
jgi:hypothetical protein